MDVDPSEAGARAIELLDADSDELLSPEELKAAPVLLKYLDKYDTGGDGSISADEIEARIELWFEQKMGIRDLAVTVKMDGRPLSDAKIEFVPEEYLGPGCKAASGITDDRGMTNVFIAPAELPPLLAKRRINGIQAGAYKIRITHPTRKIPAQFNTNTVLGEEVANDTVYDAVELDLKSR